MSKIADMWEHYGTTDPYFAVATIDKFKKENLTDDTKAEFFASGDDVIARSLEMIRKHFGVELRPEHALDFGCGVGRLVVPLAGRCDQVTGVDISPAMLAEAKVNCSRYGHENVELLRTDEFMALIGPRFDFVHSSMVFQHINPKLGLQILKKHLDLLKPGGFGALHFTFAMAGGSNLSLPFRIYRDYPLVYKLRSLIKGDGEPLIPMHLYNLNQIMSLLQTNDCHDIMVRFSDHNVIGAVLIFQKNKLEMM